MRDKKKFPWPPPFFFSSELISTLRCSLTLSHSITRTLSLSLSHSLLLVSVLSLAINFSVETKISFGALKEKKEEKWSKKCETQKRGFEAKSSTKMKRLKGSDDDENVAGSEFNYRCFEKKVKKNNFKIGRQGQRQQHRNCNQRCPTWILEIRIGLKNFFLSLLSLLTSFVPKQVVLGFHLLDLGSFIALDMNDIFVPADNKVKQNCS